MNPPATTVIDPIPGHGRALVLFSGGQDSTTCLAWALRRFQVVETVGFDYGQRNRIELACRQNIRTALAERFPSWKEKLSADHLLDLTVLGRLIDSALTRSIPIVPRADGIPNTFVPGRNLLFFTFAAALGHGRGIVNLIGGMCETDCSGYPDCRAESLNALQTALRLGMSENFSIEAPLMHLDKAATWQLAHQLGGDRLVELIIEMSHSCYLGERGARHAWGYGCGRCPACSLRLTGFQRYREEIA